MNPLSMIYFSFRLAWRQLFFEKGKFIAAILGVTFACILLFAQLGFRDSLYISMALTPNALNGDIFIQHKQTEAFWRPVPFPKSELARAYASPDVVMTAPMYSNFGVWRNPETFQKRTIFVMGMAPDLNILKGDILSPHAQNLIQKDTLIFDTRSRPEFGAIQKLLESGPFSTELNNYQINVVGTFNLGTSFSSDGNVITSEQNFMRIFPNRNLEQVDVGIIQLRPGADIAFVKSQLRSLMTDQVNVFDKQDLIDYEVKYWKETAPVGFIFGFGMVMGFVVGMVIVYQILYTDITNHLREYATMKAMGYKHSYLLSIVFSSALILAVIGFLPGLAVSAYLYDVAEKNIYIDMPLPLSKIIVVFTYVFVMCVASGIIAMRQLRHASPAEMF